MITQTELNPFRDAMARAYRSDETDCVNRLLSMITLKEDSLVRIREQATQLAIGTRAALKKENFLNSFLHQYDLSSEEGIALMCMAEALLRIPDTETIDRLIHDKISTGAWSKHVNSDTSFFINAATWSLMLTGKIYAPKVNAEKTFSATLKRLGSRLGSSVIRPIILQGMKLIGHHFVTGQTIEEALKHAEKQEKKGYRYSYDMLGESARTEEDAEHYFNAYHHAIVTIGKQAKQGSPIKNPGISVKLSALHPRYEFANREKVLEELVPRLLALARLAKEYQIGLTVDAEEADRLDLSLDIIERVFSDASLTGFEGFGLAVQAYQKRAIFVIDWLADLSKKYHRRLMVRLVKGAYWDSEIKLSQLLGLEGYPVFTRKNATDVSYLACARKLIAEPTCFYPQFGTHNVYSVAAILEMSREAGITDYEFQCLHGMGEALYDQIVSQSIPCRIYAPVGSHQDLLGYLVRRLLENGANTSFINRLADEDVSIDVLISDPVARVAALEKKPHPGIPLPNDLFGVSRKNSVGLDFSNVIELAHLKKQMDQAEKITWEVGKKNDTAPVTLFSPIDNKTKVGLVYEASVKEVNEALSKAVNAQKNWEKIPVLERALVLEKAADLFEKNRALLMTLLCREGGKQLVDCVGEIRETVDFCRYYAALARKEWAPLVLSGPTGEFNQLSLAARGVIACISPWNFPLAIFTGQVVAALVCGNAVMAKPAEQTPLIANLAVDILHEAGVPDGVLQLVPGRGEVVGSALVSDPRVAGVMFTGGTDTARIISKSLADRPGALIPFIAETGGQNTLIVDSSALAEQVVMDALQSAFNSAGQRCSALRVMFVQEEIAPRLLTMLKGAMQELKIGDPSLLSTDIGPVIDQEALEQLKKHVERMKKEGKLIAEVPLPAHLSGNYFAPCAYEINHISQLPKEVFGPILHVIRYSIKDLDTVLDSIIQTGYGLTLGIHSRIQSTVNYIIDRMPVGNIYVNRNMIGAVVGVQPFGGEGLSGTGPKAGGPHYLHRLCVERALSINTTAAGGNASLVTLSE